MARSSSPVCSGERLAVVEFQSRTQPEGRLGEVGRYLGMLGQAVGEYPLRHRLDQGIVEQVVVMLLGDCRNVLEGTEVTRSVGSALLTGRGRDTRQKWVPQ
jgi:hypothetical protein